MLPSDQVWTSITNNDRYPLRKLLQYGQFGRPTQRHDAPPRANVRLEEELLQLCALSRANMQDRKIHKVGLMTLAVLQDEAIPLERRHVEPVGLRAAGISCPLEFCHIIDHTFTGLEPLVCFNQLQKELPSGPLDGAAWIEATRTLDNVLPLPVELHKQFDSAQAAALPTRRALEAEICAAERSVAEKLVIEDEEGRWTVNREPWDIDPPRIAEEASVAPPVSYETRT